MRNVVFEFWIWYFQNRQMFFMHSLIVMWTICIQRNDLLQVPEATKMYRDICPETAAILRVQMYRVNMRKDIFIWLSYICKFRVMLFYNGTSQTNLLNLWTRSVERRIDEPIVFRLVNSRPHSTHLIGLLTSGCKLTPHSSHIGVIVIATWVLTWTLFRSPS